MVPILLWLLGVRGIIILPPGLRRRPLPERRHPPVVDASDPHAPVGLDWLGGRVNTSAHRRPGAARFAAR